MPDGVHMLLRLVDVEARWSVGLDRIMGGSHHRPGLCLGYD